MATAAALEFTILMNSGNISRAMDQTRQSVAAGVRGMAQAAQDEGKRIQDALSKITSFREMKKGVEEARGEWSKAQGDVTRLSAAMSSTTAPTRAMQREFDQAKQTAAAAKTAFENKRDALHRLRGEMRSAGVDTTNLVEGQRRLRAELAQVAQAEGRIRQLQRVQSAKDIIGLAPTPNTEREIARVQAAYERLRVSGKLTNAELARAHLAMTEQIISLRNGTDGWASRISLVREQLAKMTVGIAGIGLAAAEAIRFESAMANVRKVVDFATPQAFQDMVIDIKAMSREIPVSLDGLAKIAEAGGQMGIAAKDIEGFTEVVAKMSTAFGISPDEAGAAVGKLMNIFRLTVPETQRLANAINHLGNNTNAVERDILNVMNRVGGMARMFGLANTETAALTSTFLAMGRPPEIAATAINAMLMTLQTATTKDEAFKQTLQSIGYTAEQLAADIGKNPQQTLTKFLETLKSLDRQTQVEVISKLFGREYADDMAVVVGGLDKYKEILGLVGKEANYAGSMQKEFGERIRTTEAQLQLAKNAISEAAINLGTAFLPSIVAVAKGVAALLHGLAALVATFPTLSAAAVTTLTALAGFGALRLIWSTLRLGVISMIAPLATLGTMAKGLMAIPQFWGVLAIAGGAAYVFSKAISSNIEPLQEHATALGKSREATLQKIKTLETLKNILETTRPGTREHIEAEEKLANLLPNSNIALDEQGRLLARVGSAAKDNAEKLKDYLNLLKKDERQTLALQLDVQARAFGEVKKEMASYTDGLRNWYGIGTGQGLTSFQKITLWLDKLTGLYDSNIVKGAELRRQLGDTEGGMKSLLEEARRAGLSVEDLGKSMDGIHADPAVKDQIVAIYRTMAKEAESAAGKAASLNEQFKQFSMTISGPAAAAKKSIIDAIGTTDQQIGKYDEALSKHRGNLKQAVDDESKSWKAIGEASTSSSKIVTERIEEIYARRHRVLNAFVDAGLISEKRKTQIVTVLAIQETEARLAEARRHLVESLNLTQREYQAKSDNAKRMGLDAARVDEERLQSQRRILEQTEATYRASIDKLIAEEQRHLEAARQIAEQRASFKLSVEDRLARLAEKGKQPDEVYQSRQMRIAQEQARAEDALRNGNYEAARRHAERMMELAEQTADAVKVGNRILVPEQEAVTRSSEQVKRAAAIVDKAFQEQGNNHQQSASALRLEYGSLATQLETVRQVLAGLDQSLSKDHRIILGIDTAKITEAARQIDDLLEKKERMVRIKVELQEEARFLEGISDKVAQGLTGPIKTGLDEVSRVFANFKSEFAGFDPEIKAKFDATMATGAINGLITKFQEFQSTVQAGSAIQVHADTAAAVSAMDGITSRANALDGRVITYTVQQVTQEAHAVGGPVGLARGGRLPGFGGGDRVHAMLEAGEFVIRKEAVRRYGLGLLESLNRMRLRLPEMPRFAAGGLVRNLVIPVMPSAPAFATGGAVPPVEGVVRLDLFAGGRPVASIPGPRQQIRQVVNALKDLERGIS
ncbi:MAG: phage tail tape measure protein [Magnetococcales bacterium]|nr:phage tail tape measure protein [Magnetococcales bacterium]